MYSAGSVCFECIVHSCKSSAGILKERDTWKPERESNFPYLMSFSDLGLPKLRERSRASWCLLSDGSHIHLVSTSYSSSSVTSQLCHPIPVLRSHGTSLFSSPVRSDSSFHPLSSIVPSAPALSLLLHGRHIRIQSAPIVRFFSPFKKSKNHILKKIDWGASCGSGGCSNTVTVHFQEKCHSNCILCFKIL